LRLLRRLLRTNDRGVTVLELTIASALTMLILLAVLSSLDSGTRSERISQARQEAEVTMRSAMSQVTRDLRQAVSIASGSTATLLDMQTLIDGVQHHVVYQVVGTSPNATLQRTVDSSAATTLAKNIVAPQAFCYQYIDPSCVASSISALSSPNDLSSVRISIQLTPIVFQSGSITLATDVQLRNIASG